MPRLVHSTPKYRLHRVSGQAVVTINGKDHYLGPWRSKASRVEFDRIISEWLANGRCLPVRQDDGPTITELIATYWTFAENYYVKNGRPSGVLAGIRIALGFLRDFYGHKCASEFGPLALKALQMRMVEAGQSRPYVNANVAHLKRVFKWAVAHELVPATVFQALATVPGLKAGRTTAREPEPIGPVDDAVVEFTLPHLPPVVADMVRLHALMGCRPGELCGIRPCDVDTSGDEWWYTPESHKTQHHGRERRIPIGPRAQEILRPYLLRASTSFCFSPVESRRREYDDMRQRRKSKVQPSQVNRNKRSPQRSPKDHYTKNSYRRAVARGCEKANRAAHQEQPDVPKEQVLVPHWHPNQLRHSVATTIRKRFGLEAAQTVLGHSKADVTQVYAERDYNLAARVMREIG
jgi:integrase